MFSCDILLVLHHTNMSTYISESYQITNEYIIVV
jgi:hypothetical protein